MCVVVLTGVGSRSQRLRSSGLALGTDPRAIVVRFATPARFGPIVPLAPATFGMVWHPPQPFCAISACPSATAVGSGGGPAAGLPGDAGDEELEGPHAVATSASTPNTVTRRTRLQCEIVEVI